MARRAQRLLVTGGSGYLGRRVVAHARAAGWEVAWTYRSSMPAADARGALQVDVTDDIAVEALVAAVLPDAIIHTAYAKEDALSAAVTATGSGNVAAAAAEAAARLVHMSSDVVHAGTASAAYDDAAPAAPLPGHVYGEAKAEAERLVAAAVPDAVLVRSSLIWTGDGGSEPERQALAAADGTSPLRFFDDELRTPVQVDDLARALVELASLDVAGPLNVSGPQLLSRLEFARRIAAAHGRDPDRIESASSAALGVNRPRALALDTRRARALLATPLRSVDEVLRGG